MAHVIIKTAALTVLLAGGGIAQAHAQAYPGASNPAAPCNNDQDLHYNPRTLAYVYSPPGDWCEMTGGNTTTYTCQANVRPKRREVEPTQVQHPSLITAR